MLVFGCPQQKFTAAELEVLKQYILDGGSVLVLLAEGQYMTSGMPHVWKQDILDGGLPLVSLAEGLKYAL